ncbi:AI-2E family transporter [Fructilactobacillus myrtifloralis]|uniref:AI-2E family transporter n=1 Tax=Fructilactobacillus myrtifloralis TaxID=2940301 RepID=A0ABY5BT69_9LACO|nr:AI-2E family transporter [Fructilactobacillus myrtifloralis]USS85554.1 AI-2E family transporter [Fructilactobacillus myrtifloralis]
MKTSNSKRTQLLFWTLEILLVVAIIYGCTKIDFMFRPIGVFISTIFAPLLIAGFLYYMLNPILELLMKIPVSKTKRINRTWGTTIIFVVFIGLIIFIFVSFLPRLVGQIANMASHMPQFAAHQEESLTKLSKHGFLKNINWDPIITKVQSEYSSYLKSLLTHLSSSAGDIISMAANIVVTMITAPIILFYMLKDGDKFLPSIEKLFPTLSERHRKQTTALLTKMNQTLSHYIGGQVIECLFVGTFTTIGYFLIGQKYALLLGVFAGFCNLIPYVGPYIGILPALLVAITVSPAQAFWTIVVVIIVQQIDGNFVYPNVIGKSLNIHPLTIIIILLAAGHIAGLLGMILAIPIYAIVKVIISFFYNIWQLQHEQ